jgi:hypothetical protein
VLYLGIRAIAYRPVREAVHRPTAVGPVLE